MEIFVLSGSELAEAEAAERGYRSDMAVCIDNLIYQMNIYTPARLIQDYELEVKEYGCYMPDSNLVLVEKLDKETVINTLTKLHRNQYFRVLLPSEELDLTAYERIYTLDE